MVLEVAAAIIGLIAAGGKVVEILAPAISALKDTGRSAAAVRTEVKLASILLAALQRLLDELDKLPRRRRELIQVDQLITTLADGVLLFDELECILQELGSPEQAIINRAKWAMKEKTFVSFCTRLQSFKASISVMLNILQCESDLEARRSHQDLISLTSNLLQNNMELAQRIANLEASRDTATTIRTTSEAVSSLSRRRSVTSKIQDAYQSFTASPFGITYAFEFERDLESSWVYRKVTRATMDASVRSSVVRSHAWTALSGISLSDISAISVVALPITLSDLYSVRQHGPPRLEIQGQPTIDEDEEESDEEFRDKAEYGSTVVTTYVGPQDSRWLTVPLTWEQVHGEDMGCPD